MATKKTAARKTATSKKKSAARKTVTSRKKSAAPKTATPKKKGASRAGSAAKKTRSSGTSSVAPVARGAATPAAAVSATRGAAAPAATRAGPPPGVTERRWNRKLVLDALADETGVNGGSPDQRARIEAFRNAPGAASVEDFAFVGALAIKNWYVDPTKPGPIERASLWITVTDVLDKSGAANPNNWGPDDAVSQLQTIVEVAK